MIIWGDIMPRYFTYFPKTVYNLDENVNAVDVVTNIMSKFSFEPSFKNNSVVYYEYVITDGETPEMLAHKFYGDPEKHWVILTLNDIYNPQVDWPIEQRSLIRYLDKKYYDEADTANTSILGSNWARTNVYGFYKIETQIIVKTGEKTEEKFQVDANTYANIVPSTIVKTLGDGNTVSISTLKEIKTYLDYEYEINENKRKIKILKPEFINAVEQELQTVFDFNRIK